jgi:hypothetical protein
LSQQKVNKENEAPIHWAALKGHTAVLKLFIQKGGDEMKEFSGKNLDRPLHYTALNNHEQVGWIVYKYRQFAPLKTYLKLRYSNCA